MSAIKAIAFALAMMAAPGGASAQADPTFEPPAQALAPDYAEAKAWAARPDMADLADLAPPNSRHGEAQARAPVDVFYVHPTTYRDPARWNQDLADAATNHWTDVSVIARQASAFNACCRVYAPRYRQAEAKAFRSIDGDGGKAYNFAYADVRRAFQHYLDHDNHGRPFILAGHSQGALLVYRLVAEMIDGKPLQKQFVAAYTPGVAAAMGAFGGKYHSVGPCRTPTQTGCIASWNTFLTDGDPSAYRANGEARNAMLYGEAGKAMLCINPLTFNMARPAAPASANLGSLTGIAGDGPLPALTPATAGARCVDGVLMADLPQGPGMTAAVLPSGNLHMLDVQAFYENLRENALARTQAFLAAQRR